MTNKPLKSKLQAKIKQIRTEHSTNNNSIFSLQRQVNALFDLIDLVIADDEVSLTPQQRPTPQQSGGAYSGQNPAGHSQLFSAGAERPPTVEEVETMQMPATHETQVFMTHRGTRVIPPAYTGIAAFTLPPGAEIPRFPSIGEMRAMQAEAEATRQSHMAPVVHPPGYRLGEGVGVPSNPTVPGNHPSGPPPGAPGAVMPAIREHMAMPMTMAPSAPVVSAGSMALSGLGMHGHSMESHGFPVQDDPSGGARNITNSDGSLPGQPINAYPGGEVIKG